MKRYIAYAAAAVLAFVACSDLATQPEVTPEVEAAAAVVEAPAAAPSAPASSPLLGVSTICQSYRKELEAVDARLVEMPASEHLRETQTVLTDIVSDVCG